MSEQELEKFQVYGCNSSIWLVDHDRKIATHCSDTTWNRGDYNMIYPATAGKYQDFLQDPLFAGCREND
jgi:hypothetical protein